MLVLFIIPTAVVSSTTRFVKEMREQTRAIVEAMADAVDLRDPYTGGHSRRVTGLTEQLLYALEKEGPEVRLVVAAARVHDIGKIAIPDAVLMKPGAFTEEERRIMEAHPVKGAELLRKYPDFARGADIVRHHHEAWDGSGYPDGLRGAEIPFGARVIAVADSYDAMTSDRPYRPGMSPQRAAAILREGRNRQWDPLVVNAFVGMMGVEPAE